ncbi:MAG TPA: MiaB/RimO family radical SAM methylthiotransferase, partial [Solirubrobacteraceae bacterium]|nr:MiaB/RimO family radical SAM methylthiotransferase [Solirubrobacteraceae bacterium]
MRFAVKFLGCKVSQADAMLARRELLAAGHEEVAEAEAELHVINTCCITGEAEAKSRQAVRRSLQSASRAFVGGCAVNLRARQFTEIGLPVQAFAGTAEEAAAAMATASLAGSAPTDAGAGGGGACVDLEHDVLARERRAPSGTWAGARTRGFVKVQDGCDCRCAYCIIPTVRGGARSRPASAVLREVARRAENDQPEVVMTGISVGDYRDPERGLELGELLVAAAQVPGVQRVRLSSVEVIHVKDTLIAALREEPKVCPHLHVPMQSGDDGVLRAMGRHYTADEYLQTIRALRAQVPEVNVTTDIIVGFPSEDERAFERTLRTVAATGLSRIHVFPYSPRPGTGTAGVDPVPPRA